MSNSLWDSRFRRVLYRVVAGIIVFLALVLVGLLAGASANTEFFDRYFTLLFKVNLVIGALLVLIVGALALTLWLRYRRGKFGTRLMTKLAVFFGVVGVLPGVLIYLVSLQFVSRSIESWFDVRVETALEAGLNLGRSTIDSSLADLQVKARLMAEQLAGASGVATSLQLNRLREQYGVQEAAIFTGSGRVLATASSNYASLVPDLPSGVLAEQARLAGGYAAVEGGTDPSGDGSPSPERVDSSHLYRLRVIIPLGASPTAAQDDAAGGSAPRALAKPPRWAGSGLSVERRPEESPSSGFGLVGETVREERYLQVLHPVPAVLARNADEVQRAYQEYQEKALGRTGLRKMYIGTLTLTLFLAVFIAVMLALLLGGQLARPLLMLLQGTKEVAEGDLSPKRELKSRDELGMLTQQFNQMTRQLAEARLAVEENRTALEQSKAYLESVLQNLTAGVLVFDRRFVLITANPGAERIFRQPFGAVLGLPVEQIPGMGPFGEIVRQAFSDQNTSEVLGGAEHWQKQIELPQGEEQPLTLLVRGARLPGGERDEPGYVIVFDDISDVISAQRSVAWGEVARRLAHEIKNPLTPIQLSAERLQMKLSPKLEGTDADVLKRGAATIVNQVAAMKRMVDDFRDYARTPPAVLQSLQLNSLVAEVLHLYGIDDPAVHEHPVIHPTLGTALPEIKGDPTQLRQVIHNLLQNAQDAATENVAAGRAAPHITLNTETVEYKDSAGENRQAVKLTIADNGPGFAPRILSRAFEPYVTTKAKGTGLGLAMVKKIIDEHGARIEMRNRMEGAEIVGAQISILFVKLT
ncbi:Signal transduction histidine kinase NtrY involved in nitrogen fixation and metabolism regulation [Cupriavidus necator]|uniref:histidine kinase n=1 Tax=Cupriavidus necator (strain ATCC 17699 / DSM 428 / KCTC 22496 / NCIMB 10442 / H16 / Stanier 337) TaxID=381666 RepID=Q0K5H0_CUPNH|nr:PAS domain-containing sensor histidine kinase [Cupriavidus necator]QCC02483.1 PAS domain-containing sensor histidine kinase [Cupriavidus necator H16]QQB78108.1 PAS domain-containing sensor histidine kinase [Cupriavidus necator]WKA40896.1 PAS domain-containing sensor histidine kinase [Cupriavidus necator]CAJ94751.1 signal transduction histidine kinase, nitrogen metabolism regulator NtrY [Cupriavidus necator H16]